MSSILITRSRKTRDGRHAFLVLFASTSSFIYLHIAAQIRKSEAEWCACKAKRLPKALRGCEGRSNRELSALTDKVNALADDVERRTD